MKINAVLKCKLKQCSIDRLLVGVHTGKRGKRLMCNITLQVKHELAEVFHKDIPLQVCVSEYIVCVEFNSLQTVP